MKFDLSKYIVGYNTFRGLAGDATVHLGGILAVVQTDYLEGLSEDLKNQAIFNTARSLLDSTTLDGIGTWLRNRELVDHFDPIQVGFGVVIRPRYVKDAVSVYDNSTLRLTKQAMVDAICRVIETLPFASVDPDFYQGYYSHLRFLASTDAKLDNDFLYRDIFLPFEKRTTALLLRQEIPFELFASEISQAEFDGLKEIAQEIDGGITSSPKILGFVYSHQALAASALDYQLYVIQREQQQKTSLDLSK